jgi:hypothetical protein
MAALNTRFVGKHEPPPLSSIHGIDVTVVVDWSDETNKVTIISG